MGVGGRIGADAGLYRLGHQEAHHRRLGSDADQTVEAVGGEIFGPRMGLAAEHHLSVQQGVDFRRVRRRAEDHAISLGQRLRQSQAAVLRLEIARPGPELSQVDRKVDVAVLQPELHIIGVVQI